MRAKYNRVSNNSFTIFFALILILACAGSYAAPLYGANLSHAPVLGAVSDTSIKVWIRSDAAATGVVQYQISGGNWSQPQQSSPVSLVVANDLTGIVTLTGLTASTAYDYRVVLDGVIQPTSAAVFKTVSATGVPGKFSFVFGADIHSASQPHTPFNIMGAEQPDFAVFYGDLMYHTVDSGTESEFWSLYKVNRDTPFQNFANRVPLFTVWDDGDYGVDNGDSSYYWKNLSRAAFGKYWPNPAFVEQNKSIYYKFSVADVDFFMLDSRYNRVPGVTMLGSAQLQWLKSALLASTAKFKFIVSPVMVADFSTNGTDSWQGFKAERQDIFQHVATNNIKNVVFLSGDVHWASAFLIDYPVFQSGHGVRGFYEVNPTPLSAFQLSAAQITDPQILFKTDHDNFYGFARVDTTVVPSQVQIEIHSGTSGAVVYSLTVEEFTPTQAPTITTNYLVQGTQNAAYLQTLTAMDGVGPYQWQVINGALPPGLTLAPNGVISGTPTQASTYFFTAKVQDSANGSSSKIFSININSDVNPTLLLNQNFSGQLYTWTVVDEGVNERPSKWLVSNGQLVQQSNIWGGNTAAADPVKPGTFAYAGDRGWTDYEFNASLMSQDNDGFGVMFRYQDRQNYYRFAMDQERSFRRLTKTVGGVTTILAQDSIAYQSNRWYAVKVRLMGSTIQIFVDGALVFNITDTSISTGMVALYCWGNQGSYFDDVSVLSFAASSIVVSPSSLPAAGVNLSYNQTFTATGGFAPYAWSVSSGSLPQGLSLASNGAVSGTPTAPGTTSFSVQVRDSVGTIATRSFNLTVNPAPLSVVTTSLPSAVVNVPYNPPALVASGGTPSYSWSLAAGSALPSGLTLLSNGTISGSPTAGGTSTFTVQVQDSGARTATQSLSIVVNATSGLVGYWSFDDGTATDSSGNGNNASLVGSPAVVSGKSGQALTFNGLNQYVTVGNVLNPGLADLSIFAWVKTTQGGGFNMIVSKRDSSSSNNSGYQLFQNGNGALSFTFGDGNSGRVRVDASSPRINDGNWHLVGVVFTRAANGVLFVDGAAVAGGSASIVSQSGSATNTLPLRFGTENQNSNSMFAWSGAIDEVRIYNRALSLQEISSLYGTVSTPPTAPALTITASVLANGTVNALYSPQNLGATGGTPPYSWSVASGSLPPGLTLSTAGGISGTPTTAGTYPFTAQVRDNTSATTTQAFSILVNAALTIAATTLPNGTVNLAYTQPLTASGGSPAYTWTVSAGSLPPGVSLSTSGTVSGTPTASGPYSFTAQVRDNAGTTATQSFGLTINAAAPASPGVASYWSFDDGTAADNSGNGNNGTLVNGPTVVAGRNGQALNFNGSNQYVNIGNVLNPGLGDFSVFAWVKTTQAGSFNMIVSKRDASSIINSGYQLFQNGNNALSFAFGDGSAAGRIRVDSTGPRINDGAWHLVGAVFTRSGNGVLYVDGVAATGGSGSIAGQSAFVSNTLALRIGAEQQGFYWAGAIDDVRIYTRALSTPEITSLYGTVTTPALLIASTPLSNGTVNVAYTAQTLTATGGTPPYSWSVGSGSLPPGLALSAGGTISGTPTASGTYTFSAQARDNTGTTATQAFNVVINPAAPVVSAVTGYWSFDDGTATDNSGNGSNGTLVNGATVVAGKIGQAISLNGVNQYVNFGNVLNPGNGDLTVLAWVKTTQAGSFNMIVSKRDSSLSNNSGYQLFQNGNGTLSFTFSDGVSNRARVDSAAPRINDGNWHLAGVVFTRSANGVLYVDGTAVSGGSASIAGQTTFTANTLPLRFGTENQNSDPRFAWNGAIDDVRIYNRALAPQEIAAIYNAATAPTITVGYDGMLADRVGQAEFALTADGKLDGVFTVTLNSGSGNRTVTSVRLTRGGPIGIWDTVGQDMYWSLGVATALNGPLLNSVNDSVNFALPDGTSFKIFAADSQGQLFVSGSSFTVTVNFADGSSASGNVLIN